MTSQSYGLLALLVVEAVHDDADGEPEELVDLPHPFGVAPGEIVVDGDDMHAAAGQRVEIDRQRRDQRLAFAGLHLGDPALVQHHAADQLDVEMALAERALGGLAHGGESGHQNVVEGGAVGDLFPEFFGARAQRFVGEPLQLLFQRIDGVDPRPIGADAPLIGGTEQLAGNCADHRDSSFQMRIAPRACTASARQRAGRFVDPRRSRKMRRFSGILQGDVGKLSGAPQGPRER